MRSILLDSLYIENYKAFKNLRIPQLSRVNLIWGNNNVGKSTLLEAIWILSSFGDPDLLHDILKLRDEDINAFKRDESISTNQEIEAFLPLVAEYSYPIFSAEGIKIGKSGETNLQIHLVNRCRFPMTVGEKGSIEETVIKVLPFSESVPDTVLDVIPSVGVKFNNKYIKFIELTSGGIFRSRIQSRDNNYIPCEYISSKFSKLKNIDVLWSSISMTEYEQYVIEALQIIDPAVSRFNVLTDSISEYRSDSIPYILLEGKAKKMRLSAMGDGMNRVLMIVLAMLNCKNGIFLLDEFENGLHYSVQEKLWDIVFRLAKRLNIQVFVTTHSNDCINCFSKVALQQKGGIAIRLDRVKDNVKCQIYDSMDDLLFATQSGIELR